MNLLQAVEFFKVKHNGQARKYSGAPYITHPLRCMSRAMLIEGISESELIGVVGHDFIEDVKLPPAFKYDIALSVETLRAAGFDPISIGLMVELTNPSKLYPDLPRAERKRMDRDHIAKASKIAKQIKMIDRADNLREIDKTDRDFIKLYCSESRPLLAVCADADAVLARELKLAILELESCLH